MKKVKSTIFDFDRKSFLILLLHTLGYQALQELLFRILWN